MARRALCWMLLVAAGAANAGQICMEETFVGLCYPDDVWSDRPWVGFSEDSTACRGLAPGDHGEEIRLSTSATDASQSVGSIPSDGRIYVWVNAGRGYGYSGFGAKFVGSGISIRDYEHIGPLSHTWDADLNFLYGDGECHFPTSPPPLDLIGALVVETTAVSAGTWGRIKAMYRD